MYTIMTDATDREKSVLIYVGSWDTLQAGALITVENTPYCVDRVAVTVNRRGGQTQEVILRRPT